MKYIFVTEAHHRSLAGAQYGDGMGRLDVEPAIKQDDVASYRDQSESWTVVMRQLALQNLFDLYKRTDDVA